MKAVSFIAIAFLLPFCLIALAPILSSAQGEGYSRIYANGESHSVFGVANANDAVGSNLADYSSIAIPSLGFSRFQQLTFPQTFTAGQPIHLKLGSHSLLTVGSIAVEIQAYQNNTAVGTPISLSSGIVNLLGGVNVLDVIVASPGTSYNGVRVTVTSLISVAADVDIYAAYVNEAASTSINCEAVADVITGSTSGAVSALNSVINPNNAVDASLGTYAELRQNVGVAGHVHLTALFPSASILGDSVIVVLKVPGSSLLDASVFSNLNVVTYLGTTPVESIPANSSLLGVRLLDATNRIYRFAYPSTASFDRISVQAGGLATALSEVLIYDIKRVIASPKILIDAANVASKSICIGENTTLTINPTSLCTLYNWYDAAAVGTLLHTGTTYTRNGLPAGNHQYYVEAVRSGCTTTASTRTPVTIVVNPLPGITLGTNPSICYGTTSVDLAFTAPAETPTTYSINWADPTFANVVDSAFPNGPSIALTVPLNTPTGTYNGNITVKNANGCIGSVQNFSITVHPLAPPPALTISSN